MPQSLTLPRELTIYTVGELRPLWLNWLAQTGQADTASAADDGPWQIDAGAVEEVDAAGVQLLLSLAHSLAREQREMRLHEASPALAGACHALGLQDVFASASVAGVPA